MPAEHAELCFVDTNIWLYAFVENGHEPSAATKGQIARALLREIKPVISTQVVNEVCVNLLRQAHFTEEQIRQLIEAFYEKYPVVASTRATLLIASSLRERYSLSYWDSTIVAAALEVGARVLYSEDMQHGLRIEGRLEIRNPFVSN